MSDLDPILRARLQTLARGEESALDEPARTRLRAVVRARAAQRETRMLWPYAVLAAAILLVSLRVHAPAGIEKPRATRAPTPAVASEAEHCAAIESGVFVHSGESRRLELMRARVVADAAAQVSIRELKSCALELTLEAGRVAIHARDLEGGSLWVHTPLGSVSVRGTLFSVVVRAGELTVAVAEGLVMVRQVNGVEHHVSAGQSLRIAVDGEVMRAAIARAERARLEVVAGRKKPSMPVSAPTPPAPEATPTEPPSERVWHEGAPLSPPGPELPTSMQEDGRPMQKPRVVHDQGDAP